MIVFYISMLIAASPAIPEPIAQQLIAARLWGDTDKLARIYHANGFYDKALTYYRAFSDLNPHDDRWIYLQVLANEAKGEIKPQIQLLERTVKVNPANAAAWYRLGQAYFKQGRIIQARKALTKAVETSGDSDTGAYATLSLARIAIQQNDAPKSQAMLESAVHQWPSMGPLHRLLARVYRKSDREDDAQWHLMLASTVRRHGPAPEPMLDRLAELSRNRDLLLERAIMAGRAGDTQRKQHWLDRALHFYPDDKRLQQELKELHRAQTIPPEKLDEMKFNSGRNLFLMACAVCHGPDGRGQEGKAPPLVGSVWLGSDPLQVIRIVLDGVHGGEDQFDRQMPSLRALDDQQIADILNYARGRFCDVQIATASDRVHRIRQQTQGRNLPWTRDELKALSPISSN